MVIYGQRSHLAILLLVTKDRGKKIIQRVVYEIKMIFNVIVSAENLAQELDQNIGRVHQVKGLCSRLSVFVEPCCL
jgi:hypothetical protein